MKDLHTGFEALLHRIEKQHFMDDMSEFLSDNRGMVSVKTLSGSLRSLVVALLLKRSKVPLVVITDTKEEALEWLHDMGMLIGQENIALFVEPDKHLRFTAEDLDERVVSSIDGLALLQRESSTLTIATPDSFTFQVPPPDSLRQYRITITQNTTLVFQEFVNMLGHQGFQRKDFVEQQGDMAVRGGIVDVFALGWDNPLRIEFWGDTVDSIREFDPLSQRSIREHRTVEIIAHLFQQTETLDNITLFDHFSASSVFILDAPHSIEAGCHNADLSQVFERFMQYKTIHMNPLQSSDIIIKSFPQPVYNGSVVQLTTELRTLALQDIHIFIAADGTTNSRRIHDLIIATLENDESELDDTMADNALVLRRVKHIPHSLSKGFIFSESKAALITEHQIFDRKHFQTSKKGQKFTGITLRELAQLHRGDFVVHVDKGIGKFDGLETLTIAGSKQECIRLIYENNDILYVHLHHLHKVQKYSANNETSPKLSKLGSSEWERKKAKTKGKLKDIARELIRIYALRKSQPGYAYPADTTWQKEFEAGFLYEDTPDQAKATADVKKDMESRQPMDRLVCGDVGFGKTEVAIRAAFKAVQAGKQVIVLVPTTILAQQHFVTFRDRLHRYPVAIDVLSRFRTGSEQKEILAKFSEGKIDILIGTHRVLSKDILPKSLGLLIIDEEQRFGVGAKEKLRQMRVSVDTLTLTATPIPRTLNFSLMGARDLSVIETPPRNRLPVQTRITEWNNDMVKEIIQRELDRGGQIFFVSDRIADLTNYHAALVQLIPHLRCGIAHGQMETERLEDVMEKFIERKYDVLLATKIVESGLDIPNANTMFIHNAHNFGLAELYQLRGRVGRSNIQAYCSLLVPPVKTIGKTALRRLQALEECTDLGSGFQLAMRDLEIRGAGNLLGGEQSGFIIEMGYELYQKILDEAVSELRTTEFSELFAGYDEPQLKKKKIVNEEISIDIASDCLLPDSYVSDSTERYEFYKRLFNVRSHTELHNISSELRDRYGRLPKEAENLLFVIELRIVGMEYGFHRISYQKKELIIELPAETAKEFYEFVFPHFAAAISSINGAQFKQTGKKAFVSIPVENREHALDIIKAIAAEITID